MKTTRIRSNRNRLALGLSLVAATAFTACGTGAAIDDFGADLEDEPGITSVVKTTSKKPKAKNGVRAVYSVNDGAAQITFRGKSRLRVDWTVQPGADQATIMRSISEVADEQGFDE